MDYLLGRKDFQSVEDMITLPELTEESLLTNLRMRYEKKQIYTYTGSILVAVNPYEMLPIYTADIVKQYFSKQRGSLPPHIFAIADAAYTSMMEERKNQSIIISGESGAGKTESTKLIIQYLAARTNRHSQVEQMIVESSPILEAFGNAKTIRNNNSSRFGKFIEIQFNQSGHISGARIINYLLEKSRIVNQAKSERNYHIFYQLLAGLNEEQKKKYSLGEPEEYNYLNQSGCIRIENINDVEDFEHVKYAMQVLGLPEDKQNMIFSILAAVLHLGNVRFDKSEKTQGAEGSEVSNRDTLKIVADLLQLDTVKLETCLTIRHNLIRGQTFVVPLKVSEACDIRDALSKALYGNVFNWLVTFINSRIHKPQPNTTFIGVLDIFGFENFKKNSFEQFCINFANEKLQQHFNQHIFKLEQEEYEKERINWSKIVYSDNQECLDLIEKKPLGILSLLDEESRFPQASDTTFLNKLHINHEKHNYYEKPKLSKTTFVIKHYAGEVAYDTTSFLDKNKDTVSDDLLNFLLSAKNKFIVEIFTPPKSQDDDEDDGGKTLKKATVRNTAGNQFKVQLQSLINTLSSTAPHYVRCIKPNSTKEANNFDEKLVQDQLRYAGMMETIRIRKTGYPIRHSHKEFRDRYLVLEYRARNTDHKQTCASLIHHLNQWEGIDKDEWQVGLTKIFIRDPQFRTLENFRKEKLINKVTLIQSVWRMYKQRKRFLAIRAASKLLQTSIRSCTKRKEFIEKRYAVNTIKGFFKMVKARSKFQILRTKFRVVQSNARAFLARKKTSHLVAIKHDRSKRMEEIQREKDKEAREKKEKEERARQDKEDQDRAQQEKSKLQEEAKKKEEEIKAKLKEEEDKRIEEKKAQLKELNQFDDISNLERMLKDQQQKNISELDNMVYSMEEFSFEGGVDDTKPYIYNNKMYEIDLDALDKLSITDLLQGLKQTVKSVTKFDVDDDKFELPPGIENVLKRAPGSVPKSKNQIISSDDSVSPPISPSNLSSGTSTPDLSSLPPPPTSLNVNSLPPPMYSGLLPPPLMVDASSLPPPPIFDSFEFDPILGVPPPPPPSGANSSSSSSSNPVSNYQAQLAQQNNQLPHIIQEEEISLYSFYEFANKNFNQEKHKQKEDIFSYQKSHIKSSLLVHSDAEVTKLSVELFSKLLSYMTSNPLSSFKKDPNDFFAPAKYILTKGLAMEGIRDEIYCQLVKQSSNNPNLDLNNRIWELIHYCTSTFSPSRKLIKYFASYLKTTINANETPKSIKDSAQSSYQILQRFTLNGNRKLIPSLGELESLKDNRPIFVRITATDGSLKGVHVDSATTISEAVDDLSVRCRMRAKDNGFTIVESFSGIERDLSSNDKISDVLSKVENLQATLGPKIKVNFNFIFRKRIFAVDDHQESSPPEKDLYFHQLYNDLFNNGYSKNLDFIIQLGSLRLQADSSDYTDDIKNWLPGAGRGKYITSEIEKNKFDDFINLYKGLKGTPQLEAKKQLNDLVFSHPLAYQTIFICEHQMPDNQVIYPKSFIIGLDHKGIHIYDMNSKLIDTIKYTQNASSLKNTEKSITLTLESKVQFEIQTSESSKIVQTIKDYSLYLKNNAKFARALRDYNVTDPSLLSFKRNDIITIKVKDSENKWYIGQLNGVEGSFPVDHVEILLTDKVDNLPPLPQISSVVSSPMNSPMLGNPPPPPPKFENTLPPPISLNTSNNIPPPLQVSTPPPQFSTPPPQMSTPPMNPRASIQINRPSLTNSSGDSSPLSTSPSIHSGLNADGSEDISKRASISPNISSTDPIINWAQNRFRFFKKIGTLKKKPVDLNSIIYFTKDTIKESLIEFDNILNKKAVKNFNDTMCYMGDLPLNKGFTISKVAQSIISRGIESPEIRDEIYCQAYRQTNKNPKLESTKRGFELLYFISICFPPSESFLQPFSETLMSRSIALSNNNQGISQQISMILEKIESHPIPSQIARKQGPSMTEIQSVRSANDGDISSCKVRFVDQSTKISKISTYTTVKEVSDDVLRQVGVSTQMGKNFGVYQCNDQAGICKVVSDSDLIYDIFAKWEQYEEKGDFYLQVRRRYFMDDVSKILNQESLWTDDDVAFELSFKQIREEWMKSQYTTINEKDISFLAAILIQLDHPNQSKLQFNKELIRQMMPESLFNTQNLKFWTSQIEAQIFELVSHTPEYLKLLFINIIGTKCSIFGCTLFHIQQKENPPKALLGISKKGINIFDPSTKESKQFFTFQSISNWTFTDNSFVIMSGNLMKPTKNTFTTDEYSSISLIYQYYST